MFLETNRQLRIPHARNRKYDCLNLTVANRFGQQTRIAQRTFSLPHFPPSSIVCISKAARDIPRSPRLVISRHRAVTSSPRDWPKRRKKRPYSLAVACILAIASVPRACHGHAHTRAHAHVSPSVAILSKRCARPMSARAWKGGSWPADTAVGYAPHDEEDHPAEAYQHGEHREDVGQFRHGHQHRRHRVSRFPRFPPPSAAASASTPGDPPSVSAHMHAHTQTSHHRRRHATMTMTMSGAPSFRHLRAPLIFPLRILWTIRSRLSTVARPLRFPALSPLVALHWRNATRCWHATSLAMTIHRRVRVRLAYAASQHGSRDSRDGRDAVGRPNETRNTVCGIAAARSAWHNLTSTSAGRKEGRGKERDVQWARYSRRAINANEMGATHYVIHRSRRDWLRSRCDARHLYAPTFAAYVLPPPPPPSPPSPPPPPPPPPPQQQLLLLLLLLSRSQFCSDICDRTRENAKLLYRLLYRYFIGLYHVQSTWQVFCLLLFIYFSEKYQKKGQVSSSL